MSTTLDQAALGLQVAEEIRLGHTITIVNGSNTSAVKSRSKQLMNPLLTILSQASGLELRKREKRGLMFANSTKTATMKCFAEITSTILTTLLLPGIEARFASTSGFSPTARLKKSMKMATLSEDLSSCSSTTTTTSLTSTIPTVRDVSRCKNHNQVPKLLLPP